MFQARHHTQHYLFRVSNMPNAFPLLWVVQDTWWCQTCDACSCRLAPLGPGITSCISSAGGGTEALSRGSHSLGHKPYLLSSVGKAAGSQPSGATPTQVGLDILGCQHVLSRNSKEETTLKCVGCQTQPKHTHTLAFGTALQAQCQCLAKLR